MPLLKFECNADKKIMQKIVLHLITSVPQYSFKIVEVCPTEMSVDLYFKCTGLYYRR